MSQSLPKQVRVKTRTSSRAGKGARQGVLPLALDRKLATKLETNVIYRDDNLTRLITLPSDSIDLIYLDPPFFSNHQYEVIWGDEAEVRSFEDRWAGGVHHYVEWLKERVIEMWRVLKPTGSLYLHCDWHASHHIRVMLDEQLGHEHFQNEIIWHYRGGGVSPEEPSRINVVSEGGCSDYVGD